MRPLPPKAGAERAVQLFGGVGNPAAEAHAARLTQRFADLTGARPTFLLAPGSPQLLDAARGADRPTASSGRRSTGWPR